MNFSPYSQMKSYIIIPIFVYIEKTNIDPIVIKYPMENLV